MYLVTYRLYTKTHIQLSNKVREEIMKFINKVFFNKLWEDRKK